LSMERMKTGSREPSAACQTRYCMMAVCSCRRERPGALALAQRAAKRLRRPHTPEVSCVLVQLLRRKLLVGRLQLRAQDLGALGHGRGVFLKVLSCYCLYSTRFRTGNAIKAVFMAGCVCRLGTASAHKVHGAWTLARTSASRRSHSCATYCSSAPTTRSVSPRCSSAPSARGAPGSWQPPPQALQASPSPAQALSPAQLEHCATACLCLCLCCIGAR